MREDDKEDSGEHSMTRDLQSGSLQVPPRCGLLSRAPYLGSRNLDHFIHISQERATQKVGPAGVARRVAQLFPTDVL